jgi:Chaperone of endosialidase
MMSRIHSAALAAIAILSLTSIAFAADLAVKAPPGAPAPPPLSGYIELYSGGGATTDQVDPPSLFVTPFKNRFDDWVLGGAGRGNWWATQNLNLQLDIQAEGNSYKMPSSLLDPGTNHNFSTVSYLAAVHANFRDPQMGLLGAFGGVGDVSGNTLTAIGTNSSGVRHALGGLEGQYYWNMLTLYGQGGYDSTLDFGNSTVVTNAHAWFGRGTARYFVTPDFMLEGTGQYANGRMEFGPFFGSLTNSFNTWLWRAKAEWRPGPLPFSFFATYEGSRTEFGTSPQSQTTGEKVTDNRFMGGVRLYLGTDTLLANDRHGTSLDVIDPLGSPTSPLMLFPAGQVVFVSDARLKRDISQVGQLDNGLNLYSYRYLWSDTVYVGVMAQEVALIRPDAVVHGADGYLRVDYGRLRTHLMTLPEWSAAAAGRRL